MTFGLGTFLAWGLSLGALAGWATIIPMIVAMPMGVCLSRYFLLHHRFKSYFLAPREKRLRSNLDLICETCGKPLFSVAAALALLGLGSYLALELSLLRIFFQYLFPEAPINFVFSAIMLLICVMYTVLGGYKGVFHTDFFQVIVIGVFISVLFALWIDSLFSNPSRVSSAFSPFAFYSGNPQPLSFILDPITSLSKLFETLAKGVALVVLVISWVLGSPDYWIRTVGTLRESFAIKIPSFLRPSRRRQRPALRSAEDTIRRSFSWSWYSAPLVGCVPILLGWLLPRQTPENRADAVEH